MIAIFVKSHDCERHADECIQMGDEIDRRYFDAEDFSVFRSKLTVVRLYKDGDQVSSGALSGE